MMWRCGSLVLGLAMIVVGSTACNQVDNTIPPVESQDRIISTAETTDDPAVLRVTWFRAPCEAFNGVLVDLDEEYANLTVRVTVDVETCPDEGTSEAMVELGEPLGDRQVWDRAFGNTVALDAD